MDKKKAVALAGMGVCAVGATYAALKWLRPPPSPIEFYCPYCGAGPYYSYDELMAHIETAHPGEPPVYVCMYCGASFPSLDKLDAHIIAVHRTLWFKVAKFPGGGDPTNTVWVYTDLGTVGKIESGIVSEYKEVKMGLPKEATWVMIHNLDGSALSLVKYPIIGGIALAEGRILGRSAFWQDNPWHSAALGYRWGLDYVRFSLPKLAIPPQVTVRIEMVTWYPGQIVKIYGSTDRTFQTGVTEIATITASSPQLYPSRLYTEITARAGTYLKLDCISGNLILVLKKYWRGLQLLDAFANEDLHAGEIQEYWENYGMLRGHYLIFEAVGR